MQLSILSENSVSDLGFFGEWGFSVYIETDNGNILFDTGASEVYMRNAEMLGIDINDTDYIVLSHHHDDHAQGLQFHEFEERKTIICHPQGRKRLTEKKDYQHCLNDFDFETYAQPHEIFPDVFFLGEIPRNNDFECQGPQEESVIDDSAIAIKTNKGLVVISGCSHPGICNICEFAKSELHSRLYMVMGGFHLFNDQPETIDKTIDYFHRENPKYFYPMHCIDFDTMVKLHNAFQFKKISAGCTISL